MRSAVNMPDFDDKPTLTRLQVHPDSAIGQQSSLEKTVRLRVKHRYPALLLPVSLIAGGPALAQADLPQPVPPVATDQAIDFQADDIAYDNETQVVTATGNVQMSRDGEHVRADKVIYNQKTGDVRAEGNVIVTSKEGDKAFGDAVQLSESLRNGLVENMLIVLKDGGRIVAARGTRRDGVAILERAAYTPCPVIDEKGCPKDPVWKISAEKVTYDPAKNRIRYRDAQMDLFGAPILAIPSFSHPADNKAGSGVLIPDVRYTETNGFEFALPYFLMIDRNRDLTVTPHIYTEALPAFEMRYRALNKKGAYQIGGFATYGRLIPTSATGIASKRDFRGYFEASGRFQLTPRWSVTGSARVVTDRTFLRRYDISRDDRLRSVLETERVTRTSYFSAANWFFQTLRPGELQGNIPIAVPIFDYRKRFDDPWAGGRVELQLNTIALGRTDGQDTQRAFVGAKWDMRRITPLGQEITFTLYGRGDVYHSDEVSLTSTIPYRGNAGWTTRVIAASAIDMKWPLIGSVFGGTQRLTPRIQLAYSPNIANLSVPNEDARAVDLEDSNLFALNRFPGYDRWEDGARITYGLDWGFDAPKWRVESNIGQSYRLKTNASIFPDGTGLNGKISDIVGRTSIRYKRFLQLTHRYRLDKDSFAIRRNEVDLTLGSNRTYTTIGYLRLNRDIGSNLEDLRDREEIRLGGRAQITRHWSVFGSTIVDMTDRAEDPLSLADGFQPIRHRLGFEFEDDCVRIALTWKRDYDASGDARRGNTFLLRLSFRNLGR